MLKQYASRWLRLVVLVVSVATVLILASGGALAAAKCKQIDGSLTLQPVSGPACTAPVGICASGTYLGDLKWQSTFAGSSLTPTVDTPSI